MYFTDNQGKKLHIVQSNILDKNGLMIFPKEHKLIYRNGDQYFSLNDNAYEIITLWYEDEIIDEFSYDGSTTGMSWSNLDVDVYLTPPTPGTINRISEECDWFLDLYSENSIYQNTNLDFDITIARFIGTPGTVTVYGEIEDSFGEVVKSYTPWTDVEIDAQRIRSYTPNLQEGIYQVSFWIDDLDCNDMDEDDNYVTKIFAINPQYKQFESSLSIEKIYLGSDKKAEWGDQINVKVNIYKGNSTRTAIELWAEKSGNTVSKRSKLNIYEKFQDYTLTLPLQLHPNCEYKEAKDGKVTLILKGLGEKKEEKFLVEGLDDEVCKDYEKNYKKEEELKLELSKLTEEQTNKVLALKTIDKDDNNVEKINSKMSKEKIESKGIVIYQSSSEKSKQLIPYFLTLVFILLIIIVLFKK